MTQTNNCKQLYSAEVLLAGVFAADHRANVQTFTHNLPFLPVLLRASGRKWSKPGHEKVETGEGNHVHGELAKVGVQLTGESKARGDSAHGGADEVVQVTVGGRGELEGSEADVVEGSLSMPNCS